MNSAQTIAILAFFLTMKATVGQPENCRCSTPNTTCVYNSPTCYTRGCSVGRNGYCDFDRCNVAYSDTDYLPSGFVGCNCPGYPNNSSYAYHCGGFGSCGDYYEYDTCTYFGVDFNDPDHTYDGANDATDCCNFCCGRNDPHPLTPATAITRTTAAETTTTATTATTTTTVTTTTTGLPPECYNPDGSSCDWYKDCLEKKHPCQRDSDDYGIKYATKYCNLYTENYNKFSATGQKWVDAVRKCLQIKLVPLISQASVNVTCKQIKEEAFAFHTPCYVDPYPDAPSISFCYLDFDDLLEVFNTIKTAFLEDFIASIDGFISVMDRCVRKRSTGVYRLLKMYVYIENSALVNRISEPFRGGDELAKLIAAGIAKIESWDPKRVGYFPYSTETSLVRTKIHEQQITIEILLSDQFVWGNMDNTSIANAKQSYLNQTIDHLVQSVQQGRLELKTTDGTFYVKQMDKCLNVNCNETDGNPAVAPPYNFSIRSVNSNIFLIMVFLCVLLLKK